MDKELKQLQREYGRLLVKYTQLLSELGSDPEELTKAFLDKEAAYYRYAKALRS